MMPGPENAAFEVKNEENGVAAATAAASSSSQSEFENGNHDSVDAFSSANEGNHENGSHSAAEENEIDSPSHENENALVVYDAAANGEGTTGGGEIVPVPEPIDIHPPTGIKHYNIASRVLPSVGAFTVQCANCFKWRLIPTKEKYEEIREFISEKPFYCETAREWRPDISCDDPADIHQDGSRVWAIDKPNIAQPPPGWQRLLRIRGEGGSKFADVYYVAPSGKRLRSMVEIQKYLCQHPEYATEDVQPSQFSFQTPRPLQENYVRKRPARLTAGDDGNHLDTPKLLESGEALMKSNGGDDEIHIERRKAVLKNGIPVITFTMDEVKKSITSLKHALIGVFDNFRPNIDDMRKIINCDWGLKSHVDISIIDQKHVLIRFNNDQDFMKVWTKENLVIKGIRFHVIQWSVDFDPTKESSKQAIWIHIPKLPANFFHEDFLASIATGVGKYIISDNPTKTMSRVQGARVCVEVDLMKKLQKEIVVEWGPNKRVFEVIYENIPSFCKTCCKRGHKDELCKTKEIVNKTEVNVDDTENISSQKIRTSHNESTKEWVTRVFQPKGKKALWRPIWKPKRINIKERAGSSTQTYNARRNVENELNLQDQHKQKRGAVEEVGEKSFDNLLMIQNSPKSQIPEKTPSPEKIQSLRKIQNQQEAQSTEKNNTSISREDRIKIPKSADQEMRKKSELTQPKVVPISEMVEATTEVSSSDSADSVFYDAYLLHRITDPACTFADWKKMQNENFQEVISKKNRKNKTREKEDSISDSEYYDDENCTLAEWKKVISKKNKKRLKAREKENSMLEQRDERQKRTIRKPARLID